MSWYLEASCRPEELIKTGVDPNIFFASEKDKKKIAEAKSICAGCPVKLQCYSEAIEFHCEGVFGGTTTSEREMMESIQTAATFSLGTSHTDTERPESARTFQFVLNI